MALPLNIKVLTFEMSIVRSPENRDEVKNPYHLLKGFFIPLKLDEE